MMITITIENSDGSRKELEAPCDLNLSLMEILRAAGYDILATCGGIALCATCRVQVIQGIAKLPAAGDQELDMLDMLPDTDSLSRLACQLRINEDMNGMIFRVIPSIA